MLTAASSFPAGVGLAGPDRVEDAFVVAFAMFAPPHVAAVTRINAKAGAATWRAGNFIEPSRWMYLSLQAKSDQGGKSGQRLKGLTILPDERPARRPSPETSEPRR